MTAGRVPPWEFTHGDKTYLAELATVARFHLGPEDHGIFTAAVTFRGHSWGQGLPNYALDEGSDVTRKRRGTVFGCELIIQLVRRIGSPEEAVGRRVVVFRLVPHGLIEGFAAVDDDGAIAEPLFPEQLAAELT